MRQGGLNEYLDDLEKSDPSDRKLEKWFYTEWLARRQRVQGIAAANAAKRAAAAAAQVCPPAGFPCFAASTALAHGCE